jgi:hypothetical protein
MNKVRIMAALGTVAAVAVTACAGSAHSVVGSTRPAAGTTQPANNPADSASGATCAQASGIIQILANAQAVYSAGQQTEADDIKYIVAMQEAIAVIHVGGPIDAQPRWSSAGNGQLNHDLYQFNADASAFTQGAVSMTSTVGSDIDALATDCGISAASSG